MIHVEVNDREARCRSAWPITAGSVGLSAVFRFSRDWEGLSAVAVFQGSGTQADVVLTGAECAVPAEVLAEAGGLLRIGVYGQAPGGERVIPTVWAVAGRIAEGAEPSGFDPAQPAPSWSAQVQAAAAEALEKAALFPAGGEAGQVLTKRSGEDYDAAWARAPGGGGGTADYDALENRPQIGGVTLTGNRTPEALGLATPAAVARAVAGCAPLASPAFTGSPSAPTPAAGDDSTRLATTAFVQDALGGAGAVTSVNGRTGAVVLSKADLGLGLVDNTSDSAKKAAFTGSLDLGESGFVTGNDAAEAFEELNAALSGLSTLKQDMILASGLLKGDGQGGVSAASAGTDYATPAQIPAVPGAYTGSPAALGTASPGSAASWARGDHVHPKPGYTAAEVGAAAAVSVVTRSAPASIALADNTEYYLTDVGSLTLSYPGAAHWQCYLTITTAASGTIAVTLPSSSYIGAAPRFANGETWELSIRDGVVVAGKAGA